jgi:4-hydroxybenzoate polyprenyltransferase
MPCEVSGPLPGAGTTDETLRYDGGMTTYGIWAGLYVGSVVVLMFRISGQPVSIAAVIGSVFLAMAVYVLHRMSPEVNDAMQKRHYQALFQRKTMLFLFGLASIVASGMLYIAEPYLLFLLPIGCIAVTLYGRKTVCYPIRNILYLKPIAVGGSIAVLGWVLTGTPWPPLAALGLAIIVTADAVLCDIPDIAYDKACGCTTFAAKTRTSTTWTIALFANTIAASFLWFVCQSVMGWVILIAFPLLFLLRKFNLRIWVDLRLPLVAVIAWTL